MNIQIYNAKWEDQLHKLKDKSIKAFVFDPPYNVLKGHKIEELTDIPLLFATINKKLRDDGFVAFTGLFPTMLEWVNEAMKHWHFSDKIAWAKRSMTAPYLQIQRCHEDLFIFKKSKSTKYVETQEKFEDLKIPALSLGLYELNTLKATLADLQRRCIDEYYNSLYFSDLPTGNGTVNGKSNSEWHHKKLSGHLVEESLKNQKVKYQTNNKRNDSKHQEMFAKKQKENTNDQMYDESNYGRAAKKGKLNPKSFRYRSKWFCNVTNTWAFIDEDNKYAVEPNLGLIVELTPQENTTTHIPTIWSYLPQNQTKFGDKGENWKHPTVKPLKMYERLIRLLSEEGDDICDMFLGSGTTAVAALKTKRNFIGYEKYKEYTAISEFRVAKELAAQEEQQEMEKTLFDKSAFDKSA